MIILNRIKDLIEQESSQFIDRNAYTAVYYIPKYNFILTVNEGYFTEENIKENHEMVLRGMKLFGCSKILHDVSKVSGSVTATQDYFEKDWIPRALAVGYQAMAVVVSDDLFAKFSIKNLHEKMKDMGADRRSFKSLNQAIEWLVGV